MAVWTDCLKCLKVPMGWRKTQGAFSAQMDVSPQATMQVFCWLNKIFT